MTRADRGDPNGDGTFDSDLDRALDGGFAAAGDESEQDDSVTSPSVLGRIAELTGETPKVSLREAASTGNTPLLKPLGPDDDKLRGKYMVQGELGKGGVGAVHKGHDSDLGRDVAMKFLHDKYASEPAILHRFVEEAQIGGQLQHPGIVPVYDLGMSEGRPFFTMKLVKGETLAKQLSDREDVTDDRRRLLSVFEDVCQTMAYAHARGVVHRDLKPANIMVGAFGEVQVVDWGMGKVLATGGVADEKRAADKQSAMSVIETVRSQGHGAQSLMGSVMGTPAYMPPEQARGDVEAMDERSDVFALGAILCEILTGLPPYTGAPDELIAMAAMAQLDDCKARLADCGAEQDLVDLATRCLMPAPAARPRSAEAVAQSIHEHLAAVEARVHDARVEAAEAKVRAVALTKQRTLGLALTAAVAAGLLVSVWFWFDADEQRKIAEQAAINEAAAAELAEERRAEAEQQRDQVELIAEFMSETLEGAGPSVARGRDSTMLREMMDAAASRIEGGELSEAPEAELRLRLTIGRAYVDLFALDEAARTLLPALPLADQCYEGDHRQKASALREVGMMQRERGQFELAVATLRDALAMYERMDPQNAECLLVLTDLAATRADKGDVAGALELQPRLVDAWRRLTPKGSVNLATALANLGHMRLQAEELDDAEAVLHEALAMLRELGEAETQQAAVALDGLANAKYRRMEFDEAVRLGTESVQLQRRIYGGDHLRVVIGLTNLSAWLSANGQSARAEQVAREGLQMARRILPPDHHQEVLALNGLSRALGESDEALSLLQETLAMLERRNEGDGILALKSRASIGVLLFNRGSYEEAEPVLRAVLASARHLSVDRGMIMLECLSGLAQIEAAKGDPVAAESLEREALAILRQLSPDGNERSVQALRRLASALESQGRRAAAEAMRRDADVIAQRLGLGAGTASVDAAVEDEPRSPVEMAWSLLAAKEGGGARDPEAALALARQAVEETRSTKCGPLQVLAEALFVNGNPDEAKAKMHRAMRAWQSARSAEKKELGDRDLQWMQQRLRAYGK